MAFPTAPPILSELRSSTSSTNQIAALRALKNEIIGHEQKKRTWVTLGVLAPLARILNTPKANGKRRESNGSRLTHHGNTAFGRTDEEEARLQAIIVVGSLASGGPAFMPSIRASAVIAPILSVLSPSESSARLILAALRTLNTIANASTLDYLDSEEISRGLAPNLYTEANLFNICHLLSQSSSSHLVQHHISLSATLITRTCQDECQRNLLVQAGVLEALASLLSLFIGASGYVPSFLQRDHGPSPALEISHTITQSWLAPVLAAIVAIVDTSRSRISYLLSIPALTNILLRFGADDSLPPDSKANPWYSNNSTLSGVRLTSISRLDYLLPQLPVFSAKRPLPETSHHPPIGSSGTSARQSHSARAYDHAYSTVESRSTALPQEEESPLVAWLIYLARAESGTTRVMAAWLISLFFSAGMIDKRRDVSCAMLLIPLLVRMLEKNEKVTTDGHLIYDANPLRSALPNFRVQAPAILAMLTLDNLEIQRAAFDAEAIDKLAQLLKESYDPLPTRVESQWTTEPKLENGFNSNQETVGSRDFTTTAAMYQVLKLRESVLKALASIASISDDYRKRIIEKGVVPFVIESLKPELKLPSLEENTDGRIKADHPQPPSPLMNPIGVLVAACSTAKTLTRSVSTLRTSLMDAGLATPLFDLLKHPDVRVQIAATEVVSNLVLEFSPMREETLTADVHKVLCDHAHSADSSLRFNSIWAIAHLVSSAPRSLKKDCLSNLGPEWLLQVICNDGNDSGNAGTSTPLAMGTPNAAGEQVDLLNATDGLGDGLQPTHEDKDYEMTESDAQRQGGHDIPWKAARIQVQSASMNGRHVDDVAIQKQGLDFIRNLICGNDAAEMIDHLFEQFGQDKLFEMLITKLRPRLINAFNRDRRSAENGVRQMQPQTDMINTVVYTINNIAAGPPRHRSLVVSQQELMKLIVAFFSHANRDVRAGCAWIVINLTWLEDPSDHMNCKHRISLLKKLGVMEKLKKLEDDVDLDVRERAKTAIYQMNYFDRP
ncbi:MAG: hypothetical protein Q9209_004278 [Squamulea sp. 1 TL-2023]